MSAHINLAFLDEGDEDSKFSDIFDFNHVIGSGSFGTVISARMKSDHQNYAVKIIKKKLISKETKASFEREAKILSQMNHPNIVKFVNLLETDTKYFLVMELIEGGQLKHLLEERLKITGKAFSDQEASILMKTIISAVQYIHACGVVHRDLKLENILIKDKNELTSIKVCDFGLSAEYDFNSQQRSFSEQCGTRIYMAPELWANKLYSKPVDLWSCGIIMYILLTGKHPLWKEGDDTKTYKESLDKMQWKFPETFNKYSTHLFLKLVDETPHERYTADEVKNHPWISRKFNEEIPMTASERMKAFNDVQSVCRVQ